MKPAFALILLLIAPAFLNAQDADLRSQAAGLLERAHSASLAPNLPNLERTDTFRVFDPNSTSREGSFSRVVIQGVGRREETTFGDYHVINVWRGDVLETTHANAVAPAVVDTLMRITPIDLVRFDNSDVVRAITNRLLNERPAQCIEFDTIVGQTREENEICVDASNGTILSEKLGDDVIEYSDFVPFAGALFPSKITYSIVGRGTVLEITQTMTVLEDGNANVFAAPPDASTMQRCNTFRRAIEQSGPGPEPGNGGGEYDVVLRGIIGTDGKVHDALVQSSPRPDLNTEALKLVSQWVFLPAMCNGRPNPTEASFMVTFRGR